MPRFWEEDSTFNDSLNDYNQQRNVLAQRLGGSVSRERLINVFETLKLRLAQLINYAKEKSWGVEWSSVNRAWISDQEQRLSSFRIALGLPEEVCEQRQNTASTMLIPQQTNSNRGQQYGQGVNFEQYFRGLSSVPDPIAYLEGLVRRVFNAPTQEEKWLALGAFLFQASLEIPSDFLNRFNRSQFSIVSGYLEFLNDFGMLRVIERTYLEAAKTGNVSVMRYLSTNTQVDTGCADRMFTSKGWTAMHWAAYKDHPRVLEYLWDNNPSLIRIKTGKGSSDGEQTILHAAVEGEAEAAIEFILRKTKEDPRIYEVMRQFDEDDETNFWFLLNSHDQNGKTPERAAAHKAIDGMFLSSSQKSKQIEQVLPQARKNILDELDRRRQQEDEEFKLLVKENSAPKKSRRKGK